MDTKDAGRMGGKLILKKYGKGHFKKLADIAGKSRHEKKLERLAKLDQATKEGKSE